jgi:hypothetical protein
MRAKNSVRTARAQLSISDNTERILQQVADIGILGKTRAEVAARIVTEWIWANEDRLLRQGIRLRGKPKVKVSATKRRND